MEGEKQKTATMQFKDNNSKEKAKPVKAKVVSTLKKIQADARCCQQIIKEWGKSLAASEAVPDNHDKNSISTTGEKLTWCSKLFN